MTADVQQIRPPTIGQLEVLRKPFDPQVVGKLPRVTCGACSKKNCQQHKPAKCQVCGAWISTAHIHLDYVGHAEVTDRLLSADPAWNWEPLAWTEDGMPKFTKGASGEMEFWIKLTVCGITRLGVGSVAGNAFDAEKQLIGDALRNAAMRFGVALDLWAKEELESQLPVEEEPAKRQKKPAAKAEPSAPQPQHVERTRPPEGRPVVDTPELPPSTGPRKRKPPTVAAAPQPEPSEPDEDSDPPMSDQQRSDIARRLESLIPADKPKVMEVWRARNLPMFYLAPAHEKNVNPAFSAVHAAQALAILMSFGEAQPTLDPDEAA